MAHRSRSNLFLGLAVLGFAAVLLAVWIPLDVQTGLIEKVRRQVTIGDAMAPTVAGLFLAVGGVLLVTAERNVPHQTMPSLRGLGFAFLLFCVVAASLMIMRWAGPAVVWLAGAAGEGGGGYRTLRDTVPWKYTGYLLGGTAMIAGMVALVERRIRLRIILVAIAAVAAMIAVYDLPFDDLLLPPNGDV